MKKKLLIIALCSIVGLCACEQSPQQLNTEAKILWDKGDYKNAVPLYLKAAEKGSPEAQYIISRCYKEGREVGKNDSIAYKWTLKSAEQGFPEALQLMSILTASKKDNHKESFIWTRKCAESNYPSCMFAIALHYEEGNGTDKNTDSMFIWLRRLALLDNRSVLEIHGFSITHARLKLAEMYRDGKYVAKDPGECYMWFLIYNEYKRKLWQVSQEDNIKAIQEVEKSLSVEQKDSARARAELLLNKPLKELSDLYNTVF
jgi:uncharacterized protein